MAVAYWLKHPGRLLARIRSAIRERRHPDKPWLCPGTVAYCEAHISTGMVGLEFGGGRSTRWLAPRLARLTTVEHDPGWHAQVRDMLAGSGLTNVDLRLVPLDHPPDQPERLDYPSPPAYVAVASEFPDRSLGFALIDGHYRTNCLRAVVPKFAPGGLLVLDDAQRYPSRADIPVPLHWPLVDKSTDGLKDALIWRAPEI